MCLSIKVKLVDDYWRDSLVVLPQEKQEVDWTRGKYMDDCVRIIRFGHP